MRILSKTTFLSSPHICYEFVCKYTNDRITCGDRDKKFIYCLHARTRKTHAHANTINIQERSRSAAGVRRFSESKYTNTK